MGLVNEKRLESNLGQYSALEDTLASKLLCQSGEPRRQVPSGAVSMCLNVGKTHFFFV